MHFAKALFLKVRITDCQDLVHDQYLRLQMRRDCERKPHIHSG